MTHIHASKRYRDNTLPTQEPVLSKVVLSNMSLTSTDPDGVPTYLSSHIRLLKPSQDFTAVFDITDEDNILDGITSLNIIMERVVEGFRVVSDIRLQGTINNGQVTVAVPMGISETGNYIVTQERQNKGFENINVPIEVEFEKVEFDVNLN